MEGITEPFIFSFKSMSTLNFHNSALKSENMEGGQGVLEARSNP